VDDELRLLLPCLEAGEQEGSTFSPILDHPHSVYHSPAPLQVRDISAEPAPRSQPKPLDKDGGGSSEDNDFEEDLALCRPCLPPSRTCVRFRKCLLIMAFMSLAGATSVAVSDPRCYQLDTSNKCCV
jgi:hypothetical protein